MRVVRKETGGVYDLLGLKVIKTKGTFGDLITVTVQEVTPTATYYPATFCYRSLAEFFDGWKDVAKIEGSNG